MADATATRPGWRPTPHPPDNLVPALLIAWNSGEPRRVGDVAILDRTGTPYILGRGGPLPDDPHPRLDWYRLRPGLLEARPPLSSAALSRRQLLARASPDGSVELTCTGRLRMLIGGEIHERATLVPGEAALLEHELLLLCSARSREVLQPRGPTPEFAFGEADPHGIVGEAPRTWLLRDELSFFARRPQHVLVLGPSGAGKELCARALHGMSPRSQGPFVARSAATLPPGLIDAELFGNAKNYPNAGMRERPGLVGEADGGTLFLDEIGELPEEMQARLLRVLDAGEYHRLGEASARKADLRLIAATNRDPGALKHDLCARLKLQLDVPGLDQRRDDLPLLVRAMLRGLGERDPGLFAGISGRDAVPGEPAVDPGLIDALLRHRWTTHVRELEALLLLAITKSRGGFLGLPPEVRARLSLQAPPRERGAIDADAISGALERCGGNVSQAARELGLSDRNALYRLMKKLDVRRG